VTVANNSIVFQMLDEMLGRLNTSAKIACIAHAFSLQKHRALFEFKDI